MRAWQCWRLNHVKLGSSIFTCAPHAAFRRVCSSEPFAWFSIPSILRVWRLIYHYLHCLWVTILLDQLLIWDQIGHLSSICWRNAMTFLKSQSLDLWFSARSPYQMTKPFKINGQILNITTNFEVGYCITTRLCQLNWYRIENHLLPFSPSLSHNVLNQFKVSSQKRNQLFFLERYQLRECCSI